LISDAYREQQTAMHAKGNYGTASLQYGGLVSKLIDSTKVTTLLDYGCGRMMNLTKVLAPGHDVEYTGYDPAIPELSIKEPAQMVCCIDVLEHIEPHLLDNVLDDLVRVTKAIGLFSVSTEPAIKKLPDGRNAHLIIEPLEWWVPKLMARFSLHVLQRTADGFFALVMSRSVETQ